MSVLVVLTRGAGAYTVALQNNPDKPIANLGRVIATIDSIYDQGLPLITAQPDLPPL